MRYNFDNLIYWLSWAFEWEKINHKKNKEFNCCVRDINGIEKNIVEILYGFFGK